MYADGRRYDARGIVVCVRRRHAHDLPTRLGISVSRKTAPSAVERNTFKRRVREIFRLHKHRVHAGWDLVVVARRDGARLTYVELRDAFLACLRRAGVLADDCGTPVGG